MWKGSTNISWKSIHKYDRINKIEEKAYLYRWGRTDEFRASLREFIL